jgi:uncharacterized radical SAM protein YgiQ
MTQNLPTANHSELLFSPSFAAALISRVLEDAGFRVGIIPQPDWNDPAAFTVLGLPRLAFLVSAGCMDSMVAHYTAAKRRRSGDAYSPGGRAGLRPDRATLVYVEGIRRAFKEPLCATNEAAAVGRALTRQAAKKFPPVIIGGIEAGLRRFAHYDYWSDKVRRSILLDSKADLLVYGMGEKPILEIARRLGSGETPETIRDVRGTCVRVQDGDEKLKGAVRLPSYDEVKGPDPASLSIYAEHFMLQKENADPESARPLAEQNDGGRWVVQNPPAFPLTSAELDRVYELPFTRRAHPRYEAAGGVPGLGEVRFSLVSSRGCFGGCSFCAITFHQGRAVTPRSKESLCREAQNLAALDGFKGYIHDVGGPTANFYSPACEKQKRGAFCADRECLYPAGPLSGPCPRLKADHGPYLEALKALRELEPPSIPGPRAKSPSGKIKKIFIRSGVRFYFIQLDKKLGAEFLETLCRCHVSGQLKTAPEHVSPVVLDAMGKCGPECYAQFRKDYAAVNKRLGLKQYLVPYFISSHPGSGLGEAAELFFYLKKTGFAPDQTQDFYPTPGTMSTVMYRSGLDPRTMKPIYIARGGREKRLQQALLHFDKRENRRLVIEALREAGWEDFAERPLP